MPENFEENIADKTMLQKEAEGFLNLVDLVEKEYFTNFLNKLDEVEDKNVFVEIKNKSGIDIEEMRDFINQKIPALLEKIRMITQSGEAQIIVGNSLRDVLGNSVTVIFRTIVKVANNFSDPKVQERINDPNSDSRKILAKFSEEAAEYYIDTLIKDEEKLKLELSTSGGYLKKFEEYFNIIESSGAKNYPSGSIKAIYFRFFSEIKNWGRDITKLTEELEKIKKIETGGGNNIMDRVRVAEGYIKGKFEDSDF